MLVGVTVGVFVDVGVGAPYVRIAFSCRSPARSGSILTLMLLIFVRSTLENEPNGKSRLTVVVTRTFNDTDAL